MFFVRLFGSFFVRTGVISSLQICRYVFGTVHDEKLRTKLGEYSVREAQRVHCLFFTRGFNVRGRLVRSGSKIVQSEI